MTTTHAEREAAFRFARRLGDPGFRTVLSQIGCLDAQDVVVTVDDATVADVMGRIFKRTRPPALVAFEAGGAGGQFALIVVKPTTDAPDGGGDREHLAGHAATTIGMLFTAAIAGSGQTFDLGRHFGYDLQPVGQDLVST